MNKNEHKCAAIAIGILVAARETLREAIESLRFNDFPKGLLDNLDAAEKIVNNSVTFANIEMDRQEVQE